MNDDALWQRVHDRLDVRADPLDDPEIREALEADPERLDEYARVAESLRMIERSAPAPVSAPATGFRPATSFRLATGFGRSLGLGSIAAAAVFAIIVSWPSLPRSVPASPHDTEVAATSGTTISRFRVSVATTVAGRSHRTTYDSATGRTAVQIAENITNSPRPRDRIGPTRILVRQQESP